MENTPVSSEILGMPIAVWALVVSLLSFSIAVAALG